MIRRNTGFTLVELLITMAIIAFVLAGASQMFVGLLGAFKQQGKMAETNIEGIIGLELLRQDIGSGGYGLPWIIPPGAAPYSEAAAATVYNDSSNNPPRAFLSGNNIGMNGSDELIIKAVNIARNDTCKKWTHLRAGPVLNSWNPSSEDLSPTDQVIVISPGVTNTTRRTLVVDAGLHWKTTLNNTAGYAPDASENRFVYGVADATVPSIRMPFNRADYYISPSYVPQRCAPNTGVLVKSVISQSDGSRSDFMPLLDCVADIQVVFFLDADGDGVVDSNSQDITALSAQQIRDQLKEVRVYILSHEGQKDSSYTHNQTIIPVGGHSIDVSSRLNYRWKIYTLSIRPNNLR